MTTINIKGWRDGLKKVALSKLQMELLNISLTESKANVDKVLDGEFIRIEVDSLSSAQEFVAKAEELGAICSIS